MTISELVVVTLLVIPATVFASQTDVEKKSSNLSNTEILSNGTQNSRALDSNTSNDEALGISNTNNQNPQSHFSNRTAPQISAPVEQKNRH